MNKRLVMVLSGAMSTMVEDMFIRHGWMLANTIYDADLVVFTGGEDVSPEIYGEWCHPTTFASYYRDEQESEVFSEARELGIPMVGICRGGQFLNVMNGGTLWQDVNNHAISGTHEAWIVGNLVPVQVSSTHHQMMRPNFLNNDVHILMTAKISTKKESMSRLVDKEYVVTHHPMGPRVEDFEALYYENSNSLCYQPHPEINEDWNKENTEVFFNMIDAYLFEGQKMDGIPF